MGFVVASLIINTVLWIIVAADMPSRMVDTYCTVSLIATGMSLIGSLAYAGSNRKGWYILGILGFVAFLPIGMIGLYGMRRLRERHEAEMDTDDDSETEPEIRYARYATRTQTPDQCQ